MSVVLSPERRVYVEIKANNQLKSPKICLSMDSINGTNDGKDGHKTCQSCDALRRMIGIKDVAIRRLSEDREDLKLKLTQIHNKNIDLKQTLKRVETSPPKDVTLDAIESHEKYVSLKATNDEVMAINHHLRQHLNTLRQVFNGLHHNSSDDNGNDTTLTATNTTTTSSSDTTVQSVPSLPTKTDTKTQSTSTDFITNVDIKSSDSLEVDDSLTQTSKSSFDKWYNK